MRFVLLLTAGLALGACGTQYDVPEVAANTPLPQGQQKARVVRSEASAIAAYERVAPRVERVAEQVCQSQNPSAGRAYCNYRFFADPDPRLPANAYQTINRQGQPIVVMTMSLMRSLENDDEFAFILGHEVGHQISNHLVKRSQQQALAGIALGGLVAASGGASDALIQQAIETGTFLGGRAYSQTYELEADVVGTYITELAGYDARRGAQSFARIAGGGGGLSTHPASGQRLATVAATADRIERQRASGQPLTLPRR
ncbi:M48 family metalloprotease [Oceanomicrobium pacificus]|uniref:M48 family metalloprotease n=1 Tax=Oceanomicrobium pacificus TaxID=2692916 RepID=A0A6B0TQ45_9RHOB|nr:M48 family metalloprotease [Oceanomicrobium pacificus]MXU63915.1 M48 family metalloprotease [Oceanomicrobium pacificus]